MATKMELKREKGGCSDPKHYVVEKDFQKEKKKVAAMHKELLEHERMPAAEAHGIPALRKY